MIAVPKRHNHLPPSQTDLSFAHPFPSDAIGRCDHPFRKMQSNPSRAFGVFPDAMRRCDNPSWNMQSTRSPKSEIILSKQTPWGDDCLSRGIHFPSLDALRDVLVLLKEIINSPTWFSVHSLLLTPLPTRTPWVDEIIVPKGAINSPHLISGPLGHHEEILSHWKFQRYCNYCNWCNYSKIHIEVYNYKSFRRYCNYRNCCN